MSEELKPCPFCGGKAQIQSNRSWHYLHVEHAENCIIEDHEPQYSASEGQYELMVQDWNQRFVPEGS